MKQEKMKLRTRGSRGQEIFGMVRNAIGVCVPYLFLSAFGTLWAEESFSWKSADGVVTVPGGGATITDEDIGDVACLRTIVLSDETAVVTAQGLTKPLKLSAAVSGPGALAFEGCVAVTIAGDNEDLSGAFAFDDTPVTVASRHGLGGAGTPCAAFAKGANGNGSLTFRGDGLTNEVPLRLSGEEFCLQADTDETLVQRADVLFADGRLWVRNMEMTSGLLAGEKDFMLSVRPDCRLRIGSDVTVKSKPDGSGVLHFIGQLRKVPIGVIRLESSKIQAKSVYHWNYVCALELAAENAFPQDAALQVGLSRDGIDGGIDLCGFPQVFAAMTPDRYSTPTQGDAAVLTVRSATAATLTLRQVTEDATRIPLKFSEMAGFTYAGNGECIIVNQISDTQGTLAVSSGKVTFDWGAGWGGTNVVVGANGTLAIAVGSSGVGFYTEDGVRKNTLTIEAGGALDLAADVCVTSCWARVDGTWLKRGVYGGVEAGLDAEHTLGALTGSGRLVVRKSYGSGFMMCIR